MTRLSLGPFQRHGCYSCCCTLSEQDVLGFSSSQQPGPPTQTVYLRLKLNLCDYSLLTSYTTHTPHPSPAPLGFFTRVTQFLFSSICFNGFGLLFWEPICLALTESRLHLCLLFLSKHLPRLLNVHCAALLCINHVFYAIAFMCLCEWEATGHKEMHVCTVGGWLKRAVYVEGIVYIFSLVSHVCVVYDTMAAYVTD